MTQIFTWIPAGLEHLSIFIAAIIGYVGIAVMTYGAVMSGWHFVMSCINRSGKLSNIRIELGRHLSLGLEFFIGKDIIETIVEPSWQDLGKLATIVALRTILTFMLSWDLKRVKEELAEEKHHHQVMEQMRKKR